MSAAYRYWRVRCLGKGASNFSIQTVELRIAADGSGSNLALLANGIASASSFQTNGADYAFNANNLDGWNPGVADANPWLQFAFTPPNTYDIKSLGLATGGSIFAPNTVVLEGSDDLVTWERRILVANISTAYAVVGYYSVNWPYQIAGAPEPILLYGQARPVGSALFCGEGQAIDIRWGGAYRITGQVSEAGAPNVPLHRQVFLLRERGLMPIRATWSDPLTGAYSFDNISGDYQYTVLSYDYAHNYRAVVADNITPVPMP